MAIAWCIFCRVCLHTCVLYRIFFYILYFICLFLRSFFSFFLSFTFFQLIFSCLFLLYQCESLIDINLCTMCLTVPFSAKDRKRVNETRAWMSLNTFLQECIHRNIMYFMCVCVYDNSRWHKKSQQRTHTLTKERKKNDEKSASVMIVAYALGILSIHIHLVFRFTATSFAMQYFSIIFNNH